MKFEKSSKKYHDIGIDDTIPLLNYFTIKEHPILLYSNIRFLQIYKSELKNKFEGCQFLNWKLLCEFIPRIKYSDLKNITPEEFETKCSEALK